MGFIDSDNDTEASSPLLPIDDEESLNAKSNGHLSSPLLTDAKSPTNPTKDGLLSPLHSRSRKRGMTETEEILEELEDDTLTELFSPSPFSHHHHRRSSAKSTPSKARGANTYDEGQPADDETTALLGRTETGRSYKDKRRRRRSEPSVMGSAGRRRSSRDGSQEALGGWWKMGWWRSRDGKGKDADDGRGNDHT